MRQTLPYIMLWVTGALLLFAGCDKKNDEYQTRTYTMYKPVFESKTVVYGAVKSETPRALQQPGKIYVYGHYLFVNELEKGVHVFDNADPSSPRPLTFINIPGNIDIAIRDHYLYADLYTDLVTLDITDPLHAKLADTLSRVFGYKYYDNGWNDDADKFVVGWIAKDTTVTYKVADCRNCEWMTFARPNFSSAPKASNPASAAGSTARFAVVNNFLYAVLPQELKSIDLENAAHPRLRSSTTINSFVETIYPFKNQLYLGSATGMYIFNIDDPADPKQEGLAAHFSACDPVVTDGNYAYVTLRSGNQCNGFTNQLEIYNIEDASNPSLVKVYPMFNPYGLGKDGNTLFICDGTRGLKVYDATDPEHLQMIYHFSDVNASDVIPFNNVLIATTARGISQFDYSDVHNIRLLSTIEASPPTSTEGTVQLD